MDKKSVGKIIWGVLVFKVSLIVLIAVFLYFHILENLSVYKKIISAENTILQAALPLSLPHEKPPIPEQPQPVILQNVASQSVLAASSSASKTASSGVSGNITAPVAYKANTQTGKLYDQTPSTVFGRKFDIKYDSGVGVGSFMARNYLKHLNDAAVEVERFFNYTPKERVTLVIVPKSKFLHVLNAPAWAAGHYNNYRREIRLPFEDDSKAQISDIEKLKNILRHEYAHAIINELSGGKCPNWLNEGLAQLAEGEGSYPHNEAFLKKWLKNNPPLSMAELTHSPNNLSSNAVNTYYAQSLFLTKQLINKYGKYKVMSYLKGLKDADPQKDTFNSIFQKTPDKFNAETLKTLGNP